MSKTGKSNHQILTLAMAEFSSVDLGSMTASSYLHSTGTYIGDIIHSGNRSTSNLLFANYMYIFCKFKTTGQLKLVWNMSYFACFSTLSQSPILISEYSGLFTMECNIDVLRGIKWIFKVLTCISHSMDFSTILHGCAAIWYIDYCWKF